MKGKLLTANQLLELYPALRSPRGKNPYYRLQWLTRSRQIPIVKLGRRIYFDPAEIDAWIEGNNVPVYGEER